MKLTGSLLKEMGIEEFSFKNTPKIIKEYWKYVLTFLRITWAVIKFAFNPTWDILRAFQRLLVVPVVEIFLGEKSTSTVVGKLYAKFLTAKITEKRTGSAAHLMPDLEEVNFVITELKLVKIMTLFCLLFVYTLYFEFFEMLETLAMVVTGINILSYVGSFSNGYVYSAVAFLNSSIYYIFFIINAWLSVVAFRLMFISLRELNRVDAEEIQSFVNDALEYLNAKGKEVTDEEMATTAKKAVLATIAVNKTIISNKSFDDAVVMLARGQKVLIRKTSAPSKEYDFEAEVNATK